MLRGKRYKGLQTILQTAGLKIIWASQTAEFMASPPLPFIALIFWVLVTVYLQHDNLILH